MKKLRKESQLYTLVEFIASRGSVYKNDALLYGIHLTKHKTSATRLVNDLLEREYIEISKITVGKKKRERREVEIIKLTDEGIRLFCFVKQADTKKYFAYRKQFDTKQIDKLKRLYNQNHVKTMFAICNVKTEPSEKPSLAQLYMYINNQQFNYTHPQNSIYKYYGDTELKTFYEQGIYYSDTEYKEFHKTFLQSKESITSIFCGLFISKDKTLVIYSNGKEHNRMIYMPYEENEILLMRNLKIINFANTRTLTTQADKYKVGISALTISDAPSFIYSTALGRKNGRINKVAPEKDKLTLPVLSIHRSIAQNKNSGEAFNHIYSVVFNRDGVNALHYLLTTTAEQHLENTKALTKDERFELRDDILFPITYRLRDTKYPCIYMPVYELKTLNYIKELEYTPAIITKADMTNVIQHITHKQHIFIDIDTLKPIPINNTVIYDEKGYVKGKKMLEEYLHENKLTTVSKTYRELPKLYDMTYNEFYNNIAKGKIDMSDLIRQIPTTPYEYKRYRKSPRKQITVSLDIYNQLKEYAKAHNITLYTTTQRSFKLPDD